MGVSKIIVDGQVKIDITDSTVDAEHLLAGIKAYDSKGDKITGTCTFDSDTTDANALAGEILEGKFAYVNKNKLEGTMPNRGKVEGTITDKDHPFTIPNGYHDGSGTVGLSQADIDNISEGNIRDGVSILGVTGTYAGEGVPTQVKTVTSSFSKQTVLPDAGYNLSKVEVDAMPYTETPNAAGGLTITIG